ncbi:hypothetical protein HOLDEFILI_01203, partial [Holdemania filiformis DSM 12042]
CHFQIKTRKPDCRSHSTVPVWFLVNEIRADPSNIKQISKNGLEQSG